MAAGVFLYLKKAIYISFILCLSVVTQFSNGQTNNEVVELNFWHTMNSDETKTLQGLVSEFEKSNPGVKVNIQLVPFSEAQNKYKIAAGAGDAPDIFRSEIAWIADFAELGFLEDLTKRVSEKDRADHLEAAIAYGEYKGALYAIPQVTDCLALLYNKEIFAKKKLSPPKTMGELVEVGRQLTDQTQQVYALGINPDAYWSQVFIWAFGGDLINARKRSVELLNEKSLEGLDFFRDLYFKHQIVNPEIDFVNGYNNMMTAFKHGKTAMILNGPWSTSDILTGKAFKNSENLGVAVIPKGVKYGSPVGGHSYVLYAGSKLKDLSFKFISFLSQKKHQVEFAKKHNLLPTRRSAYLDPAVKSNKLLQGFKEQLEVATNRPVIPEGSRIYTSFNNGVQALLSKDKEKPSSEVIRKVAKKWKKLLR